MSAPYTPKVGDRICRASWLDGIRITVEWVSDHGDVGGCDQVGRRGVYLHDKINPWELWVEPKPTVAQRLRTACNVTPIGETRGILMAEELGLDPASTDRIVVLPDPQEGTEQWLVTTERRSLVLHDAFLVSAPPYPGPPYVSQATRADVDLNVERPVVISVVPAP